MKKVLNNKIRKIIDNGNYFRSQYFETLAMTQERMSDTDYSYYITTTPGERILHFYTNKKLIKLNVNDFEWRMLWDKLGNIAVNGDEEIEEEFEHFAIGTDTTEIWQWFEWFFNISLGKELFE